MKKVTLTRKDLHDLVWSTPLTKISEKFQISIPDIKQACTTLKVPLPNLSYWSKKHLGHEVLITELSHEKVEKDNIEFEERVKKEKRFTTLNPEMESLINEIESQYASDLIVPDKLTKPDPLIEDVKATLQSNARVYHGSIFPNRNELDIHVSKDNISRAMLFMDTLIKLFRKRGYKINVSDGSSDLTIRNTRAKFFLREKMNRTKSTERWGSSTYSPSGTLYLKIEIGYINKLEWSDGSEPLENQLSKIIAKLELKVGEVEEQERLWKIESEKREKEERRKQVIENKRRKEEADFNTIINEAKNWKNIEIAKEYIDHVEKSLKKSKQLNENISQKILWMRNRLEQFDPIRNSKLVDPE
jgi:hypothetical protein